MGGLGGGGGVGGGGGRGGVGVGGDKKARREVVGPSASAESTQPKVWQQQEVFLSATEVTDERSTEEDMASDEDAQSQASRTTGQPTKLSNTFCPAGEEILVDFVRDHPGWH